VREEWRGRRGHGDKGWRVERWEGFEKCRKKSGNGLRGDRERLKGERRRG
jgi:hypothetical protein